MSRLPAVMPDFCNRRHPFNYVTALQTLMKLGIDPARVNLLAVGYFESYKGGVVYQEPEPGTSLGPSTDITLHVSRLSAVDSTAYQFFYGLEGGRDRSDDWEDRARELMAPFDSAAIRFESLAGHESHKYNLGIVDRKYLTSFLELFDFRLSEESPDIRELLFWVSALPSAHVWMGNARGVAAVISHLLKVPVEIVESVPGVFDLPPECRSPLGGELARLGEALVLGRSFRDLDSTYEVIVEHVPTRRLPGFLPGGSDRQKLEWLLSVTMPSQLEYRIRVVAASRANKLGREHRACYLGYGSYTGGGYAG